MVREVVEMLAPRPGGVYVDTTLGGGGHARFVLEKMDGSGLLIGIDRDQSALEYAGSALKPWADCCRLLHGNFSEIKKVARDVGVERVDGMLFDLGMSSMQVDRAERGFSFMRDGPLDMRMDPSRGKTAAQLIDELAESELAEIIEEYGEERAARRIARTIVLERGRKEVWTTQRLARVVASAAGGRRGRIHPATRTFQALRIVVNDELEALSTALEDGITLLAAAGRLAVISYHSLEDRRVKQIFKKHIGRWASKPEGGRQWEGSLPAVRAVVKKPLRPSEAEVATNPRARSAKLRCIERMG